MVTSVKDVHPLELDGHNYRFRSPTVYDPARARRILTRQGVRRPAQAELQHAALAGISALAEATGEAAEGVRQRALMEEWYGLLEPIREDDIDDPDLMTRGEERLETERRERIAALYAEAAAVEANLERHWPAYRELLADRNYWDDLSRIEVVRLLLTDIDGAPVPVDEEGMMTAAAYGAIAGHHRLPLATFAFRLLAPDETQRKN
jgi:hypothetical protein